MVRKLLFRLLPVQVLLGVVGAVNGFVSGYFATNFVGIEAMSAVGLYSPLGMLITTISTVLVGGSIILCGKYLGRNEQEMVQNVFSLNMVLSVLIAACFIAAYAVLGVFDLTGFLSKDPEVRRLLNRYLLGQALGIIPQMLGNSLAAFLSLENRREALWQKAHLDAGPRGHEVGALYRLGLRDERRVHAAGISVNMWYNKCRK